MERSNDIMPVKLLPSLVAKILDFAKYVNVNCMPSHSAYVLSKLILKLSEEFEILLST